MSILVEIAAKADVSVEGVVRVLTREPVSDAIKERVLAVLDDLTPEQTRAVQRFALAALHDVLAQQGDGPESPEAAAVHDESQLTLPVAGTAEEPEHAPVATSDAALVELSSVLGELAEAVRDLRRETDAERRERVDDLAVVIDLITTGWQGLDNRLGRIERQVSRLESARREPFVGPPSRIVPTAIEAPPAAAPPVAPKPSPPPARAESSARDRLPIVAALTLVGAGIVTLAVLQLASGGPDVSHLVSAPATTPAATTGLSATTGGPTSSPTETRPAATTARPAATTARRPPATAKVPGTRSGGKKPAKPPAAATTSSPKTLAAPPTTTTRAGTRAATPPGFRPTRNWAWAPVKNAAYYDVVFTRQGAAFYRGSPTVPRLTLPGSVVFRPGAYRWVVRPGFGDRAAKNLGAPVVDSPFTVS